MIDLYNQVPSVYVKASRDFQYLSWLFNIVLNAVKHNVDDMYNLPNATADAKLSELLAMTLGFNIKRNYDEKQLTALVSILPTVLKYKGTKKAISMAAEALVKATGSLGETDVEVDGTEVRVALPKDLADVTLFLDLLDYILPAGMTCRIVRKNKNTKPVDDIRVVYGDTLNILDAQDLAWIKIKDGGLDEETTHSTGLTTLYDSGNTLPILEYPTANITVHDKEKILNTGLVNNSIIPVLADSRTVYPADIEPSDE